MTPGPFGVLPSCADFVLRQTPLWPAGRLARARILPTRQLQRTSTDSAPLENDHWTILRPRGQAGLSTHLNSRDRHVTSHVHEDAAGPLTPNQTRQCEGQPAPSDSVYERETGVPTSGSKSWDQCSTLCRSRQQKRTAHQKPVSPSHMHSHDISSFQSWAKKGR